MNCTKAETIESLASQSVTTQEGSLDHVLDILASHNHPFLLVGCAAQRWMGSNGTMTDVCEILIRNNDMDIIASKLVATGKWEINKLAPEDSYGHDPIHKCDSDLVLNRLEIMNDNEFSYLALWSENSYHISVDECATIEVPDAYCWQPILIKENWHPAMHRENGGWWYGPRVHPDTKMNFPLVACPNAIFFPGLPRDKSDTHPHPILIPALVTYIDALIYHQKNYKTSKPGLCALSSWQLSNLTRYLYLESDHQQLPLLIELEEYEFMEVHLRNYVRKPRFVYGTDEKGEFKATRVKEWDPESYPEWCGTRKYRRDNFSSSSLP